MRRVLVIGPPGSGKSTFARRLAEVTGLPLIHLDAEYWQPGWVEPQREAWRARVASLAAADAWIIEGNYDGTLDLRFLRADTLYWFESGRLRSMWRVVRRIAGSYGRVRPDMAPGCPERIDPSFMLYIWRFSGRQGLRAADAVRRLGAHVVLVKIGSDVQSARVLEQIEAGRGISA